MLGLQLGRLPSELADMTAAEETLLMAQFHNDPWGDYRADVMLGQIAQILVNQNLKKEKRLKLTAFLPWYRAPAPVTRDPDVESKIKSIFGWKKRKKET